MLNEDAVRVKKLEKEMAESKTWSLHEIQLLTVELEGKQGEVTQLMKQMEQRETEVRITLGVILHINSVTGCVMGCDQGFSLNKS